MSEAERIRRQNYKRNRKRWILAQAILLTVVIAIALSSFLVYRRLNRTYYIEYTESSSSSYRVQYNENNFFEEEWLDSGQSYVSSLVKGVMADFNYELNMDVSNVAFDYTYEVFTQLVVSDKTSGAHIYDPEEVLIPETKKSVSRSDTFSVDESVYVDFAKNNGLATQFINVYGLKNAKAALWVTLKVDVISASDDFEMNNENTHSVSLLIPLCEENFSIENMTSLPSGESKVLACKKSGNQNTFLGISVSMSALALILTLLLIAFAYFTKNEDVTYANRVRKILNSYRSFIQRIYGEFDTEGYQIVLIKTFVELLGIRDTIQSPVLMCENTDETRAQFLIPTNTKILYIFEIKVDNYDELYGAHPEWVDDSLVKLDADKEVTEETNEEEVVAVMALEDPTPEYVETPILEYIDEPEEELIEEPAEEPVEDPQSQLIINLFAEMEKIRQELKDSKESQPAPVVKFDNQLLTPPYVRGNMNFGSFTAGGNVTINYHEMPDESTLREAAKLFAAAKKDEDVTNEACEDSVPVNEEPAEVVEEPTEAVEELAEESETPVETAEEPAEEAETPVETVEEPAEEAKAPIEAVEEPTATEYAEVSEGSPELQVEISESENDEDEDSDGSIVFYDENENKLNIRCRRSCLANIIQSENELTKAFYSELKNYILSFKGVKARMSWRHESFAKGRQQLFKLKIRGKTICMYCALDPNEFDFNKYYHKAVEAKMYEQVPMLVKIKSPGALKKAKKLVDIAMERYEIKPNASYVAEDFVALHPYERTQALIDKGLIKILVPEGYVVADPRHIVKAEAMKKVLEARAAKRAKLAEEKARAEELQRSMEEALAQPDLSLADIDYVDEVDEKYEQTEDAPGVEVVNVVWPEHEHGNKLYRYDPDGHQLVENDIVLVPAKDSLEDREVVRKATVAHGNHLVNPKSVEHPLKKIIKVIRQKFEAALMADPAESKKDKNNKNK